LVTSVFRRPLFCVGKQVELAEHFGIDLLACCMSRHYGVLCASSCIIVPSRWAERLRSCTVQSDDGWNALSDHYPIVAEFV
jgi:hypothetical protein